MFRFVGAAVKFALKTGRQRLQVLQLVTGLDRSLFFFYLKELDSNAGKHKLQKRGDDHDVTNGPDGHKHTLDHVLKDTYDLNQDCIRVPVRIVMDPLQKKKTG